MTRFAGASTAVIDATATTCFEAVCDTPSTPDWHQAIRAVEILERNNEGRTSLVRVNIDAMVTTVNVLLRLSYDEPHTITMEREAGDLRHLTVRWTFQEIGDGRSQASFETEFDPGRVLSAFAKGPIYARLQQLLAEQPPAGLKTHLEQRQR